MNLVAPTLPKLVSEASRCWACSCQHSIAPTLRKLVSEASRCWACSCQHSASRCWA